MPEKLKIKTKLWLENERGEIVLGAGKIELLEQIAALGSIRAAAREMGLNYKKAWDHLKTLQENAPTKLIYSKPGRDASAGTRLSPEALELIKKYKRLQKDLQKYADRAFERLFKDY